MGVGVCARVVEEGQGRGKVTQLRTLWKLVESPHL